MKTIPTRRMPGAPDNSAALLRDASALTSAKFGRQAGSWRKVSNWPSASESALDTVRGPGHSRSRYGSRNLSKEVPVSGRPAIPRADDRAANCRAVYRNFARVGSFEATWSNVIQQATRARPTTAGERGEGGGGEKRTSPRPCNQTKPRARDQALSFSFPLRTGYFSQRSRFFGKSRAIRKFLGRNSSFLPRPAPAPVFLPAHAARGAVREREGVTQEREEKKQRRCEARNAVRAGFKWAKEARNVH